MLALVLIGAMWAAMWWRVDHERAQAIAEASSDAAAYSRSFAERTRRLLREIDQATRFLKLGFEQREARGERLDLTEYTRRQRLLPTDVTLRISLIDAKGDLVASNQPYKSVNLADRDYFLAHRASDDDELLVGAPIVGRGFQRVVIALSRRLNHADGTFAGVIVMAVAPEYFTGIYEPRLVLRKGFVALLGTDAKFRAVRVGNDSVPGELKAVPQFDAWALGQGEGTAVFDSPFDATRRIFSRHPIVDFPLIAIAGISEEEALTNYRRRESLYLAATTIASLVVGALAALLLFQGRRLRLSRRSDREGEARLRMITDHMPALISYLDADQRIRFANQAYRDWLGVDPESAVGKSLAEFYGAVTYAAIRPHIEAALTGKTVVYEREFQAIEGIRHASVTAVPHRDESGKVIGLYVMTTDITEQRTMEKNAKDQDATIALAHRRGIEQELALQVAKQSRDVAEQANVAKSAFLATMSHEIRTPMNGVIGMVDVLSHSHLSADQAETVATIRTSALALLGSIDAILDFSKIEAGALELERCAFALPELVERVCQSLVPVAAGKGVALRFGVDSGVPRHVWGDPTRVCQVLYNLIGNAIKFSAGRPGVPGHVSLRVAVASAAPLRLAFAIADDGIGIAAGALERLFKPFAQAEATTTRRFGGTGLGLVISKRLVERMQGEIAVHSVPGEGSTFTVTLPFDEAEAPLASSIAGGRGGRVTAPGGLAEPGETRGRILVAEDDEISQKVIRRQLALLGYAGDVVGDGAQALRLWRNGSYALLITDLHMPEMDGYSLARAVRGEEKARGVDDEATRIPILALTANAQFEEANRIRLAGMDAHLTKPIQLAVLRTALEHWFPHPDLALADAEGADGPLTV